MSKALKWIGKQLIFGLFLIGLIFVCLQILNLMFLFLQAGAYAATGLVVAGFLTLVFITVNAVDDGG